MLSDGVTKTQLDNGLTVLVKEDHTAPVVAIFTHVKAGYFNESDRLVGLSHLMEHMFFKGTEKFGVGEIARKTKALGGYLNASTIYDHTLYYTVLPARNFTQGLEIQSDALINSIFDPDELRQETEVVIQEAKRKLDMPASVATEKLFELAFKKHRMRRWRIGTETGLRALTRQDFLTFHQNLYRPENIMLAVVGDVNTQEALDEIRRYYGDFAKGQLVKEESPPEPPQQHFRYRHLRGDIQQCYLDMGFHTPEILRDDTYALEILAFVLGQGKSSRLYQQVKEKEMLVNTIAASNYALKDVGIFEIKATTRPENLRKAILAIFSNIDNLRKHRIAEQELRKARNSLQASFVVSMESAASQANLLAASEALGDFRLVDDYLNKLFQVTQEDILRVTRRYLTLSNLSLLEYVPDPCGLEALDAGTLGRDIQRKLSPETTLPQPEPQRAASFENILIDIPANGKLKEVTRRVLKNGLTLLIKENHHLPLVAAGLYARGGRLNETSDNAGISGLAIRTALKGTAKRNAAQIATETEMLGTNIVLANEADYLGFSMNILSRHFQEGWQILVDILSNPCFPDEEVAKEKENTLAAILRKKDDMFRHPLELFYSAAYKEHPYGFPALGKAEIVENLTSADLKAWHARHFRPENMVAAFVGDVDAARIEELVERAFGEMPPCRPAPFQLRRATPLHQIEQVVEQRDKQQTAVVLGYSTPEYTDAHCYPLTVLQNIASGLGGRFFEELRGKQSLAYTVAAFSVARASSGNFISYIATAPQNEERAKWGLLNEFEKLKKAYVSEAELQQSIQYTMGTFEIGLETNRAQLAQYIQNELLGRGVEEVAKYPGKIAKVTREDILSAAQKYFDQNRYATGVVRGKS